MLGSIIFSQRFIPFSLKLYDKGLDLLKLISQQLDISLTLALKVGVVALKGFHLSSQPRLVLLIENTALLIVCIQTTLHCIIL